jgi:fructose-1,6-bisphosphatase/inositol monophosphatase family enzyme
MYTASGSEALPNSLAYGECVVDFAALELRRSIGLLATAQDPHLAVDTKIDQHGVASSVTAYDKEIEKYIASFYANTNIRIKGEEGMTVWPAGRQAVLDLHADPIDGTNLFIDHVWNVIHQEQPQPVCGSMVSLGASLPTDNKPLWGAVAAPFVSPEGVVRWSAAADGQATRLEPGSRHPVSLPHASELALPTTGGVVLVASGSSERAFRAPLEAAGYRVIKYKSAVAAAVSLVDPSFFDRLRPGELGDQKIVGAVMASAKNWDVAGTIPIAQANGHFVSDPHGKPRDLAEDRRGAVFAGTTAIGHMLVDIVSRAPNK